VSGGEEYMCAITTAGATECWSYNETVPGFTLNTATVVPGLESGVVDIAGGETHVCVLMDTGAVQCWGWGGGEQNYGSGSFKPPSAPTPVAGLGPDVQAVTSGDGFSCVLLASGTIQCWGSNTQGELGDGTNNDSATPVTVTGLPGPAAGVWADQSTHPCALLRDGSVWCWGALNSSYGAPTPVETGGFAAGVTALTCGNEETMTCALLTTSGVQCWGTTYAGYGYGPGGMTNGSTVPVDELSSGVAEVRSGDMSLCALMSDGTVECWGDVPGPPYTRSLN
jgi:alpha-tubulin suppressor-like RCC1 family protein